VSGNLCAFPKCTTPLVDPTSGSIVGEICHIKGDKKNGAARYDKNQSDKERQGFDNLLLLCNVHHKIVDDDEVAYTVERLIQMKKDHECRHKGPPPVDDATAKRFVTVAITNSKVHGSVVTSHGQTGGQTAHIIHNYQGVRPTDEPVQLEGKLEVASNLQVLQAIGCPGMQLTVICRGTRQAKIKYAHLHVEGDNFLSGFQQGFGTDFGHTPLPGSTQTLGVKLIPLSPPNSPEGYILNRDDVCRFFYPLPHPPTVLALRAKPEQVSMGVELFDGTEQTLLSGRDIQGILETVFEVYKDRPGRLNVPISVSVRVSSLTLPKVDNVGQVNPNYAPMAEPGPIVTPPAHQESAGKPKKPAARSSTGTQRKARKKAPKAQSSNKKDKGGKKK
jgi:hypothetical protein